MNDTPDVLPVKGILIGVAVAVYCVIGFLAAAEIAARMNVNPNIKRQDDDVFLVLLGGVLWPVLPVILGALWWYDRRHSALRRRHESNTP